MLLFGSANPIFTDEISQKRSHLSLCLSADSLVLNVLGTPSIQPLITLATALYSARCQPLIPWKTKERSRGRPKALLPPDAAIDCCEGAIGRSSWHWKCFLGFERVILRQVTSECMANRQVVNSGASPLPSLCVCKEQSIPRSFVASPRALLRTRHTGTHHFLRITLF